MHAEARLQCPDRHTTSSQRNYASGHEEKQRLINGSHRALHEVCSAPQRLQKAVNGRRQKRLGQWHMHSQLLGFTGLQMVKHK